MIFGDYLPALVAAAISILLFSLLLFRIVFYYDIDIYLLNKEEGYSDSVQQYGTTHIWLITKFMAFCDLSKDRNENENLLLVFRTGRGTSSSLSSWLSSSSYSNSSSSLQQTQLLLQRDLSFFQSSNLYRSTQSLFHSDCKEMLSYFAQACSIPVWYLKLRK